MKNQLLENREALGKFRDNSKTTETGEDGYWEFFHLVGYVIFPSIDCEKCCVTIEEKNIAACIVVYNNIMKSQKFILSAHELELEDSYVDISSLSESDKLKISNEMCNTSKSDIESFIRGRIESYINTLQELDVNMFCNKWPQREKCLEMLGDMRNNIDQLYKLRTDFYEKP